MKSDDELRLKASAWFLDIHDVEDPSPELLQAWMQWMEASADHRRAFMAVERIWRDSAACTQPVALYPAAADGYDGSISVSEWRERQAEVRSKRLSSSTMRWKHPKSRFIGVLAATLAAIAIYLGAIRTPPGAANSFTTRAGEQMQVTLPDGSQVSLGAKSTLNVAYVAASRDVRLETGEAFFTVKKDASRPFRVHVLAGVLTAVGTAFDVRTTENRVRVAVTDGIVQINGASTALGAGPLSVGAVGPAPSATRLKPGEAMSFVSAPGHPLESAPVMHVDPAEQTRWREGWLVYRDESLRDVLADVSRYVNKDIIVSSSLVDVHFTGAVYTDSITEWLKSLPNAFPVDVTVDGSKVLISASALPR